MTTDIFNLKEKLESAVAEAFRNGIKDHTLEIKCQGKTLDVNDVNIHCVTLQNDAETTETYRFIISAELSKSSATTYTIEVCIKRSSVEISIGDILFTSNVLIAQ